MVKIKDKSTIKKNYEDSISRVPTKYKEAVLKTTGVIQAAIDAEELWAQKIQEAISSKRRANALAKVTDAQWRDKASTLGAQRIGTGMKANAGKQATNFAPYHDTLAALELPARTADPMANIDNRVKGVVNALVAKKREIKG